MKSFFGAATLIFVGVVGWRIGGQLSSDALGMAVGILFGVMAGIPTALILLASQRREVQLRDERDEKRPHQLSANPHPYQPPVIVVAGQAPSPQPYGHQFQHPYGQQGGGYGQYGGYPQQGQAMLPGPVLEAPAPRQFKVVGEVEEMVEQW